MTQEADAITARRAYRRAHAAEIRTVRAYEVGRATVRAVQRAVNRTYDALARAIEAGCDPEALADDGRRFDRLLQQER